MLRGFLYDKASGNDTPLKHYTIRTNIACVICSVQNCKIVEMMCTWRNNM